MTKQMVVMCNVCEGVESPTTDYPMFRIRVMPDRVAVLDVLPATVHSTEDHGVSHVCQRCVRALKHAMSELDEKKIKENKEKLTWD